MDRKPNPPPPLVSRPLPQVGTPRPLAPGPPLKLAPRTRALYQASLLARVLPAHPHLHAITPSDLAREWGVDRFSIMNRLTGAVEISGIDLLWMADELGVTPHELLAGILAYYTPEERASRKLKNRLAKSKQYYDARAAREAAGRPVKAYTLSGRRAPIHTLVMERLPPDERSPLPPGKLKSKRD